MKKTAIAWAVVLFSLVLSAPTASACGDKLLFLSRIYRHHELTSNTIAIFARPNSLLGNVAALKLDKVFQQEGYHLLLINSDSDLAMAIQSGTPDVVIADFGDVGSIEQLTAKAKIPIIPVMKKDDSKGADAKRFGAAIKAPVNPDKLLDALDQAFESKDLHGSHTKTQVSSASLR